MGKIKKSEKQGFLVSLSSTILGSVIQIGSFGEKLLQLEYNNFEHVAISHSNPYIFDNFFSRTSQLGKATKSEMLGVRN